MAHPDASDLTRSYSERLDAVKLHNLYVVHDTPLAEQYAAGQVKLLARDEYLETVVDFLELLPPECVVERVSGEAPPDYLIAPTWCLDKDALRRALEAEFARRETWQGKRYGGQLAPRLEVRSLRP